MAHRPTGLLDTLAVDSRLLEHDVELYVDDRLVDHAFIAETTTVEEALRHVQSNVCAADHLVIGLHCDGEPVSAEGMANTLRQPALTFDRLDVATGTKGDLVFDAMEQAAACLEETEEACQRVAGLLTAGQTVAAAEMLGECVRIWQPIHESVAKSIAILRLDPERTCVGRDRLADLIEEPKKTLLQVRDALKAQDFVLLADLLQYEFDEIVCRWRAIVSFLRQTAQESGTHRSSLG